MNPPILAAAMPAIGWCHWGEANVVQIVSQGEVISSIRYSVDMSDPAQQSRRQQRPNDGANCITACFRCELALAGWWPGEHARMASRPGRSC